jgi:hypothetical protein
VQLGGPVLKDKFWFFGSFQYQKDADSQPGTDPQYPARSSAKRYFYKLNYQLNQENACSSRRTTTSTAFRAAPRPPRRRARSAWRTVTTRLRDCCGRRCSIPPRSVEARYSGFYGVDHGDPLNGGPRVARRFNDLDTGQITGGIYSWYDGKSQKTAMSGTLTKFADNFMNGHHDLKLGLQYNSGLGEYTYGLNDYIYTYGATPAYGYTSCPTPRVAG